MLQAVTPVLLKMLHLSCLSSNDVADVAPFPTSHTFGQPLRSIAHLRAPLRTLRGLRCAAKYLLPQRVYLIVCSSLSPDWRWGKKRFFTHRVDAAGVPEGAMADHNNIKINPVFRGMLRENSRGFNQRKYCVKHWS
jgi:hypothetical protein